MSMETIYLGIVIFLFVLAIFDLVVGVSNDAVNFLQSAVGAKAASFKTMLFIAGVGVFIGAALSNGMMDIARHGIYQPQHFYFAEIMCILLAVMLTDVVLLDVFNIRIILRASFKTAPNRVMPTAATCLLHA